MINEQGINRRQFMQWSTAMGLALNGTAFPMTPRPSPGDRITIGMIGVGARAHQIMQAILVIPGTEIVGVCDAYKGRQERAVDRTGGRAKVYPNYQAVLADKSIDAVVIATPDHWHKTMVIDALRAGKDVYVEKPLTYAIDEGMAIVEEVRKTGRILQVGSQGISTKLQQKAREIIQSGKLGQITMVRATFNRNTASGAWIYPIPPDASPETVNWEMFLGSAPKRPYDNARFFRWRCYWDYSGGISTDLFVHLMTTIHFLMTAKAPKTTIANGGLYRWKESRDVPDTINAVLEYPEGFMVNLSGTFNNQMANEEGGFYILGTEGTLVLGTTLSFYPERVYEDNAWIVDSWPKKLEEAYYNDPKIKMEEVPSSWAPKVQQGMERWEETGQESTVAHFQSFVECVRTRTPPLEDALRGHRAAAVAHLVNLSYKQKRMIEWDFDRESVKA
ncbi:MAG TPA: Gfo/Idh/MocA family oxidoreductase [Terriglobia bacterium]|nr:Gfo/Idh/MocA family oxidoreductase [Terriglobia bacterium]